MMVMMVDNLWLMIGDYIWWLATDDWLLNIDDIGVEDWGVMTDDWPWLVSDHLWQMIDKWWWSVSHDRWLIIDQWLMFDIGSWWLGTDYWWLTLNDWWLMTTTTMLPPLTAAPSLILSLDAVPHRTACLVSAEGRRGRLVRYHLAPRLESGVALLPARQQQEARERGGGGGQGQ